MRDCLFCKIAAGEIPADVVLRDDQVTVFKDIKPAAPVHLLVIPNRHIPSVQSMEAGDEQLFGRLLSAAKDAAQQEGIAESGYRLIINNGPDAHQEVFHVHIHVLGGGKMKHPMG